ncbi:uncharacterized protein LOC131249680 [Magnolia sinica]|uniref:uncharacterized protein LOC131249680 n=1 Tax=Magnolia sinica TaxID=86752 RepID=UPI002659C809|nr:uncharacterized protein LOC131249680 [Magnolia sinica]
MSPKRSALWPVHTTLIGFSGGQILPEGMISLPLTAKNSPHRATVMIDFLIVDQLSVYNAILGWPSLCLLEAVVSTYHLFMKFSTGSGVRVIKGDQQDARCCYMTVVKTPAKITTIESLDLRTETYERGQPVEDLIPITLVEIDETKTVRIGSSLQSPLKDKLVSLLRRYADVFAWSHEDMPRIDPSVMTHRLNINLTYRPIQQKRQPLGLERYAIIEEEVSKLLKVKFIEEIYYPKWVANVILVKKANGK